MYCVDKCFSVEPWGMTMYLGNDRCHRCHTDCTQQHRASLFRVRVRCATRCMTTWAQPRIARMDRSDVTTGQAIKTGHIASVCSSLTSSLSAWPMGTTQPLKWPLGKPRNGAFSYDLCLLKFFQAGLLINIFSHRCGYNQVKRGHQKIVAVDGLLGLEGARETSSRSSRTEGSSQRTWLATASAQKEAATSSLGNRICPRNTLR